MKCFLPSQAFEIFHKPDPDQILSSIPILYLLFSWCPAYVYVATVF